MFYLKTTVSRPFKKPPATKKYFTSLFVILTSFFCFAYPSYAKAIPLASYFNTSSAVMLMIDPNDGTILDANPAAEVFYGWSKQALQTMNIAHINTLPKEEIARRMQMANRLEQNYFVFNHRTATKEERRVEVYVTPMVFEEKNILISTIIDASPQKNVAYDRQYFEGLAKEALEAERLAKEAFEKNTPYAQRLWSMGVVGLLLLMVFLAWQALRQKHKKQEIEKELRYFKLLFEHSEAVYIVATDTSGVISFFNQGARTLLGYEADEVIGKETPVVFHDPKEITALCEDIQQELGSPVSPFYALTHGARKDGFEVKEVTLADKRGNLAHLLLCVCSLKNAKGEIVGYLGIGVDRSKQFELIAQYKEQLKTRIQTLQVLELGTWTWDVQTGHIHADDQCYRLLGHLPQSFTLSFETWLDSMHPDDRMSVQESLEKQLAQGDETLAHYSYSNASGEWVWVESYGRVTARDEKGEALRVVGTMRCLSDAHRARIRPLF